MTKTATPKDAAHLIKYIKGLTQLTQKPIYNFSNYEEILWADTFPDETECDFNFPQVDNNLLAVKKPFIPSQPDVSESLKNWIIYNASNDGISLKSKIEVAVLNKNNETEYIEHLLSDVPKIQREFDLFLEKKWNPYINEKKRVKPLQDLYDKLFSIHQTLLSRSESIQFIFGIGLLSWNTPNDREVKRHLLTSEVELKFEREKALFTISSSFTGLQFSFEEDMLEVEHRLNSVDLQSVGEMLESLNEEEVEGDAVTSLLKAIVSSLDSRGVYTDEFIRTKKALANPVVSLSPSFILRERPQKSIQKACDQAIEQLEQLSDEDIIPGSLFNMFSPEQGNPETLSNENEKESFDREFYFPLPSNDEQSRIVAAITHKDSVLVQGPPGTGKTHTIANLTSHLLATGQRVLITSQTAKALSVLKEKLPAELQNLCVSLLGGDSSSLKDLETVVSTISMRKEFYDVTKTKRDIAQKEEALKASKEDLNRIKSELFAVREKETYRHDLGAPYTGTAQQIASTVSNEEASYNWYWNENIMNLTEENIQEEKTAVATYIQLHQTELAVPENYKNFVSPSMDHFFDLEQVIQIMEQEAILLEQYRQISQLEDVSVQQYLTRLSEPDYQKLKSLFASYKGLENKLFFTNYPFLERAVTEVFQNRGHYWASAAEQFQQNIKIMEETVDSFELSSVDLGKVPFKTVQHINKQLIDLFENGKGLGNFFFKPKVLKEYKNEYNEIKYDGQPIKELSQARNLKAYIDFERAYTAIRNLMDSIEIPFKHINPKIDLEECKGIYDQLKRVQDISIWRQQIIEAADYLTAVNFDREKIGIFQKNFEVLEKKKELKAPQDYMNNVQASMEETLTDSTNPVYKSLLESLIQRDKQGLKQQYEEYQHLQKILNRDELIAQTSSFLERINPMLLSYLQETLPDSAWTIRLQNWLKAAHWRKVQAWLKDFSTKNEDDLADEYERTEKFIKATITDIGALKAWNSMLTSMTDLQNSHLKAWTKAVKRVGKGTGKNAPRYRREAQDHMEKCKDAIPAWIMPLYQVFENFEVKPDLFDVVIIDEASQSWHEAILLKYIAKKIIIVGDDKQISPSKIGIQVEDVAKLQNRYLKPIDYPFMDTLNLGNSFFDVAYVLFRNTITLREHFRCMPEIIEFSNRIAYIDQPLFALRQYPANRLEPIKSKYLPHGVREGSSTTAINEVEAKEIVKEIKKCLSNPAYNEKSIGVISLQGSSQANLIQQLLLTEVGAEIMEERNIICGDAYAFQGDERDIIFLSMVAAKGTTRLTSLTSEPYRQRFNVAVSRAKDQLWLMHSITVNDINNSNCMRYQLLNYIQNPLKEEQDGNREKCDSQFEKDVFDAIVRRGYRVLTQYEVAGYRIDLVVMGENAKLAVECDGDHWHTSTEDMENDFRRQRVLERAGWNFWRVLGSTYYLDQSKALESLWERLDEMDIRPYLEWSPQISELADTEEASIDMTSEEINKIKVDINSKNLNDSSFGLEDAPVSTLESPSALDDHQLDVQLPVNDELSRAFSILTQNEKELEVETANHSPIAANLIEAISIVEGKEKMAANEELLKFKDLLANEGFNVLLDSGSEDTLVVLGSVSLGNELERLAPKDNSFSFHKNGFKSTNHLPCWSITLLNRKEQNTSKAASKTKSLNPPLKQEKIISGKRLSELTVVDQMLEILKAKGIDVIDNRQKSETLWVIGTEELEEMLEPFKSHNIFFRFMRKGSITTSHQPAWFAKITK